ncbi:MAG TPA: acetate kinase [Bryobacteraceae bacterium]|nr:acetate kinase [Bryobacteraceae bacterium]
MTILVLNAGSSSLKFHLFDDEQLLLKGMVERISAESNATEAALDLVFERIGDRKIDAVGHRVVHGGDLFPQSTIIDQAVEKGIEELCDLAPLHNPHSLACYRLARARLPGVTHVAVFDTAFHHTLPPHAYHYALPLEYLASMKIRRYGFHGISHRYVSAHFARLQKTPLAALKLITCHLGNGCSMCAVDGGESVDVSMGLTPLEGLVMGTRSGDIDPGAVLHLILHEGKTPEEVFHLLNYQSGLLGLSGDSNDMRDLIERARKVDPRASLAIDVFCYRAKKYIGAYLAAMNGADAIIFTAGIGENAPEIRAQICEGLDSFGIAIDAEANARQDQGARQVGFSKIPVWVIPANEELLIARDTAALAR